MSVNLQRVLRTVAWACGAVMICALGRPVHAGAVRTEAYRSSGEISHAVVSAGQRRLLDDLAAGARKDLQENILPFWARHCRDTEHGGFVGRMANDRTVIELSPKGLVLNTRILWTFSAAYRFDKRSDYRRMANRAYDYLVAHFWDSEHGGAFWMVDYQGKPLDASKEIYGQSFVVYSLAEYYLATGRVSALEKAKDMFALLEAKCHDDVNGGYFESFSRDWTPKAKATLGSGSTRDKKTMNSHLHLLEAYTNLCRAWKDPKVEKRLRELVDIFEKHIVDPKTSQFRLFFDAEWNSTKDIVSYGHDIEGSWLLCEAVDVLGDEQLAARIKPLALRIARAVLARGVDADGGLFYEKAAGEPMNKTKSWWPQAETVVGFLNAYELGGGREFLEAADKCRHFIEDRIVDSEHGEWLSSAPADGRVNPKGLKVSEWKAPYHNSRACLEIVRRCDILRR